MSTGTHDPPLAYKEAQMEDDGVLSERLHSRFCEIGKVGSV
jgi:hypothetical protein